MKPKIWQLVPVRQGGNPWPHVWPVPFAAQKGYGWPRYWATARAKSLFRPDRPHRQEVGQQAPPQHAPPVQAAVSDPFFMAQMPRAASHAWHSGQHLPPHASCSAGQGLHFRFFLAQRPEQQ